ncbi:hypothetical protein AB6W50_25675, partial [Klebsiella pneumoniae]
LRTSCPNRIPVISKLVLVLDIYSSLSLIWRYSYCLVFQGATSLRDELKQRGIEVKHFHRWMKKFIDDGILIENGEELLLVKQ